MKEYNLDSLKEKRFWRELFRRGMSLLLAIIMVLPTGGGVFAAEITHDEWYKGELEKALKILPSSDKLEYEVIIPYTRNDSRWFAETKARQLFDEVIKELTIRQGILNIDRESTTILPVWEGTGDNRVLKSIKHTIKYHNSKSMLDKYKTDLAPYLAEIVKKETDLKRVADAVKIVKSWENTNGNKLTMILFSILMDELGYKHELDGDFDLALKPIINVEIVAGILKPVNVVAGTIGEADVDKIEDNINKQIEYEINSLIEKIGVSKGKVVVLGQLTEGITGSITITKFNEIVTKGAEIEIEIDRYDDAYNTLEAEGATEDGLTKLETSLNELKTNLNDKKKDLAGKAVTQAEISKTLSDLKMAKDIVGLIDEKVMKSDGTTQIDGTTESDKKNTEIIEEFNDRIKYVEQVMEAIAAVDKAVKSKKAEDYGVADALVNGSVDPKVVGLDNDKGIAPYDVKDDLNKNLTEIKDIIDADAHKKAVAEASKLVTLAEGNLTKYLNGTIDKMEMEKSKSDADGKVKTLAEGDDKKSLTNRMTAVVIRYTELDTAMTAVKLAVDAIEMNLIQGKGTKDGTEVDVTKDNVTTIDFGIGEYKDAVDAGKKSNAIGKALNTRIVEINKVLDAIEAVKGLNRNTLKPAKTAVGKINVKFSKVKNILNGIIADFEDDIANEKSEDLLNAAFTAVTTDKDKDNNAVTSTEIAALIKAAKTLIGKETDNIKKIRLTAVINAIDSAQKAKEAVALAEATMLRKDYDKALALVNQIPDSVKLDIVSAPERVDYNFTDFKSNNTDSGLKDRLNLIIGPIGQAENEKAVRDAVAKVEKSLTRKDYITAFQVLNKNFSDDFNKPDGEKDKLQKRLDAVNTVITATEEVIAAEKSLQEYLSDTKGIKKIDMAGIISDTNAVIDSIIDMAYDDNKVKLSERMAIAEESAIAIAAVMDAEKALAEYLLADATSEIDLKTALDNAITAANDLLKSYSLDTKVKGNLEKRLDFVRDELIKNGDINTAKVKVETAENALYDKLKGGVIGIEEPQNYKTLIDIGFETDKQAIMEAITDADNAVKPLKGTEADKLKKRVTSVKSAMDIAVLILEAEKDNGLNKAKVDTATKALAKMGDSEVLGTDGGTPPKNITVKDYYQARVDDLNKILVKAQQFEEATKLTQKAFETMKESDINKAIDYVSKMQDSVDKKKFNQGYLSAAPRINGIQNIVDKLAGTVRDKINYAIPLVAVNDKTAAKAVTDAKKSFESFKKIVGNADNKLVVMQKSEDQVVKYKEAYDGVGGHIPHYNSSLGVLDKSLNIWKLMTAAEKSKKKEDVEAIRKIHLVGMTFEDIKTVIGSVDPVDMTVKVDSYKLIADGLENKQKELEDYQSSEADRQEQAQLAIDKAKVVLNNYATKTVGEDVYDKKARKDGVRTNLTIEISTARIAIEGIKDAAVKKTKLADLAKIEVYRDAIVAVGNALAYPTQATYKAAESAVKKCSYDYGLVLAELQSELRDINDILDSYAKAEKATKLVEIAEQTKLQSDVDKARMDVNMLDDSNPAKKLLGERLDAVQKFIDTKDDVDRDATTAARGLLEKALINITQASRYFDLTTLTDQQILEAYALLRGREGVDEEGKPIIEAGARHFIRDAKSEINKISDILLKETLNKLIIQREEELESALHEIHIKASENLLSIANVAANERLALATDRSKVESGEWTEEKWTDERLKLEQQARRAIEEARNTIDEMFLPGFMTQKDNLMRWLNEIIGDLANENAEDRYLRAEKLIKEASDAVEKAARSREEADKDKFNMDLKAGKDAIFFAQQAIHAIPAGYNVEKVQGLQKVLDGLQMLWQNISDGVTDEKTIAEARELIEIVKQKLQAWKTGDETEKNVEIAFTIARNKVMGIIDNAKRIELNLELDALEEQFTADGGQVIIPNDGKNKQSDFDKARAAVLKAVETRLQKDVDAARKLVAKLVDGPSKDAMNRILDGIIIEKSEEEKRKEEEAKRKEEEKKRKAEEARKKKYPGIDDALDSKNRDTNTPDPKWGEEKGFKKK